MSKLLCLLDQYNRAAYSLDRLSYVTKIGAENLLVAFMMAAHDITDCDYIEMKVFRRRTYFNPHSLRRL